MKSVKRNFIIFICLSFILNLALLAQPYTRSEIKIPDILGFTTLKCDFHMHTVFSDGSVWPDIRVEEAWQQGLDAIAISDHIEYQPHKKELGDELGRSFSLAQSAAGKFGIVLINALEVTRNNPPGHLNVLFINNYDSLKSADYKTVLKSAKEQGAFIQMNHPFWRDPDYPVVNGLPEWFPEHEELFKEGLINGIEIVNDRDYYPEAFRWAAEKGLTLMGNSDIHHPANMYFDFANGDHRALTLVFAKENSLDGIKEALFAGRTAVYFEDKLAGSEKFLKPVFENSVSILNQNLTLQKGRRGYFQIKNSSDVPFELELNGTVEGFNVPQKITLHSQRTVMYEVSPVSKESTGKFDLKVPYKVKNLITGKEKVLDVNINLGITYTEK